MITLEGGIEGEIGIWMKKFLKMLKPVKIIGRISSVTNGFVNEIISAIQPREKKKIVVNEM